MSYGYHFTTMENWQSIRRQGLIPYELDVKNVSGVDTGDKGIMMFSYLPIGPSLLGGILWQATRKCCMSIVLLRAKVNINRKNAWSLSHNGSFENWVYHKQASGFIYLKRIPPRNIQCIGSWNLISLVEGGLDMKKISQMVLEMSKEYSQTIHTQ